MKQPKMLSSIVAIVTILLMLGLISYDGRFALGFNVFLSLLLSSFVVADIAMDRYIRKHDLDVTQDAYYKFQSAFSIRATSTFKILLLLFILRSLLNHDSYFIAKTQLAACGYAGVFVIFCYNFWDSWHNRNTISGNSDLLK